MEKTPACFCSLFIGDAKRQLRESYPRNYQAKHKFIVYYELSYRTISWQMQIKPNTYQALFFHLFITKILVWLMMTLTGLAPPWLSCTSKGRRGIKSSKGSQVKKNYRAGSDALHDKYVVMSTPQNKWEKKLGNPEEVKKQHSHLPQLKGFFGHTRLRKTTKNTNQRWKKSSKFLHTHLLILCSRSKENKKLIYQIAHRSLILRQPWAFHEFFSMFFYVS